MAIKSKVITVTTSQINNWDSSPVEILPDAASGITHTLLAVGAKYIFNTTAFAVIQTVTIRASATFADNIFSSGIDTTRTQDTYQALSRSVIEPIKKGYQALANVPNSLGDGSVELYVIWDEQTDV